MKAETVVIAAFVLVGSFYVALLLGPTAIGGMLIAVGLGLCTWLLLLFVLPYDLVFWSLVFADLRGFPSKLIALFSLVGLALIAAGILLIVLDAPASEGPSLP